MEETRASKKTQTQQAGKDQRVEPIFGDQLCPLPLPGHRFGVYLLPHLYLCKPSLRKAYNGNFC